MRTSEVWILFAAVIGPGIVVIGMFQEEPLKFIVIVGLLMFFATGAGINLGALRENAREHEGRERRKALERDIALDQLRSKRSDYDEE